MALPSSGTISLTDIQTEFGGTAPTSLSEYYRSPNGLTTANNTSVPLSGAIAMSNFYGATRQFSFTISSNTSNANLRTLAVAAGWDTSSPVVATINSGVYVYSNSTGTPALTINGSFPSGVSLVNSGTIVGMGGNGGYGSWSGSGYGGGGGAGGTALAVSVAVSITNSNVIAGGGGGGGGGQGGSFDTEGGPVATAGGGGGGGQTGITNSSGGGNGYGSASGAAGTVSSYGAGGGGETASGSGGNGGGWGSAGSSGGAGSGSATGGGPYSGGAGGNSVTGNSNITWVATGTRYGTVS